MKGRETNCYTELMNNIEVRDLILGTSNASTITAWNPIQCATTNGEKNHSNKSGIFK